MPGDMTDEEREHLKAQLDQARAEGRLEPEENGERQAAEAEVAALTDQLQQAEHAHELAYDITPAAEPGSEPEDDRQEILTAFIVYIDTDGKAVATSEIEQVLENTRRRRDADLPDFIRACSEVVEDVRSVQTARATAQMVHQVQMQMVHQAQQAAQDQQLLQGIDLSKVRT